MELPQDDKPPMQSVDERWQKPDPTPEEIIAACAAIRASWSEDEKIVRSRGINLNKLDAKRQPDNEPS